MFMYLDYHSLSFDYTIALIDTIKMTNTHNMIIHFFDARIINSKNNSKNNSDSDSDINKRILDVFDDIKDRKNQLYNINPLQLFTFVIFMPNVWKFNKKFKILYDIFYDMVNTNDDNIALDLTNEDIMLISSLIVEKKVQNIFTKYILQIAVEKSSLFYSIINDKIAPFWKNIVPNTLNSVQFKLIERRTKNSIYLIIIYSSGRAKDCNKIIYYMDEHMRYICDKIQQLMLHYIIKISLYWNVSIYNNLKLHNRTYSSDDTNFLINGKVRDIIIIDEIPEYKFIINGNKLYNNNKVVYVQDFDNKIEKKLTYGMFKNMLKSQLMVSIKLELSTYNNLTKIIKKIHEEIFKIDTIYRNTALYFISIRPARFTNEHGEAINTGINLELINNFLNRSNTIVCAWPILNPGYGAISGIMTSDLIDEYMLAFPELVESVNVRTKYTNINITPVCYNDKYITKHPRDDDMANEIKISNDIVKSSKITQKLNNMFIQYNKQEKIITQLNDKQTKLNLAPSTLSDIFQ